MGVITPDAERLKSFLAGAEDGPIVMINLLRFRAGADYPEGFDAVPCSGHEAYGRYSEAVQPLIMKVGGRPFWFGLVRETLIAEPGEAWDNAVLIEYPTRQAFIDMVSLPEYQQAAPHRTAALSDSRLIATSGALVPPPV